MRWVLFAFALVFLCPGIVMLLCGVFGVVFTADQVGSAVGLFAMGILPVAAAVIGEIEG